MAPKAGSQILSTIYNEINEKTILRIPNRAIARAQNANG